MDVRLGTGAERAQAALAYTSQHTAGPILEWGASNQGGSARRPMVNGTVDAAVGSVPPQPEHGTFAGRAGAKASVGADVVVVTVVCEKPNCGCWGGKPPTEKLMLAPGMPCGG